jgi:hypothetical protein
MEENEKQPLFGKVTDWYKDLPDKKKYVEFVTAILSVPVLVTVIISNVSNLRGGEVQGDTTPTPTTIIKYVTGEKQDPERNEKPSPTPTPTISPTVGECKKEVGPVDVTYPEENGVVTENPVTVTISYTPGEFCAVVWSYRINGASWSPFDDKSIALYGMTAGEKKLELKVKSIASGAEKTLTRNFSYQPVVEASDSAELE